MRTCWRRPSEPERRMRRGAGPSRGKRTTRLWPHVATPFPSVGRWASGSTSGEKADMAPRAEAAAAAGAAVAG